MTRLAKRPDDRITRTGKSRRVDAWPAAEFAAAKRRVGEEVADGGLAVPHDLVAEQSTLGAVILDNAVLPLVRAIVQPESFYHPAHALIFQCMLTIADRGDPIDVLTLTDQLRTHNRLNSIGGMQYLAEMTEACVTIAHVETHARTVKRLSFCRSAIVSATEIAIAASDGRVQDVEDAIERIRRGATATSTRKPPTPLNEAMATALERFAERLDARGEGRENEVGGLSWCVSELRASLPAGSQIGDMVVIAAHTSVGKTAFAIQQAVHVALEHCPNDNDVVAVFSLEMLAEALALRLLCALASKQVLGNGRTCEVSQQAMLSGMVSEPQFEAISKVMQHVDIARYSKLLIVDMFGAGIDFVEAHLRTLRAQGKRIRAVVIDYLQQMESIKDDEVASLAALTKRIKKLAGEEKTVVYLLSQLSRGEASKDGKLRKPTLRDLHGSSTIEKDADAVVFLHREDKRSRAATIIVAKWRNSQLFEVECEFRGAENEFVSITDAARTGEYEEPRGEYY